MKLAHCSDLHLGKRVHEFSLLEDQRYILKEILRILDEERADGVMIAGDVYDKSIPSAEAMQLLEWFLRELAARSLPVFLISGNHDSAERLAFGRSFFADSRIYLSPAYDGSSEPVRLADEFGELNLYLLPFVKPAVVRNACKCEVNTYEEALRAAVAAMHVDPAARNILIAHQFVAGAGRCDSEEISVGGLDAVPADVFDIFDYVALGHIHGPQSVGRETLRYCGTPLKYSFSETTHEKSLTFVTMGAKGDVKIKTVPLTPLRDMRKLRGTYMELTAKSFYQDQNREDYLQITLTDEEDVPRALEKLRSIYPNLMVLTYDNRRTRENREIGEAPDEREKTPMEWFAELYRLQNNEDLSRNQTEYLKECL